MTLDNSNPILTPTKVDAVNCDTLFPDISPMLFFFANYTLILALEAADNRKHIFLPIFAIEASAKKWLGNLSVNISIYIERFNATMDINLHFLMSSSKFLPYLDAKRIAPNCPIPSFNTQV